MRQPYYDRDGITIYHGDCMDVIPGIGPVDHVITDPPYGEETHSGARSLVDDARSGSSGNNENRIDFASLDAAAVARVFALSRPRRWVVSTIEWRHMLHLEQSPPPGLRFIRHGVWVKPDGAPQFNGLCPATGWEAVAILHSTERAMRWNGGGSRAVWTCNVDRGLHPTQKPLSLLLQWVRLFTDPGELILDPFMGSGTTLIAAKLEGRRAVGIELEEKWCEAAANRLEHGDKAAGKIARGATPLPWLALETPVNATDVP